MVETIAPVVYGRRRRYLLAVALHAGAAATTGALLGALLGGLGWALGAPWGGLGYLLLAAIAGLYLLREAGLVAVPLPQARRQVPEWWRRFFGPLTAATLYGAGLGPGFTTYLSHGTYAAVGAGVFLSGNPALGAAACGAFGAARGLAVLAGARARDEDDSAACSDHLARLARGPWPARANGVALALVAAVALAA